MASVGIIGIGSYVPEKTLTNHDLEKKVKTSSEWIFSRTGILERRIAAEGTSTSDLAVEAARRAIADAAIDPCEIDLIVLVTASPDFIFPATACQVQNKLGIKDIPAFDVMAVCTGFSYGLSVAAQYVATRTYKTVLLVGAEAISRFIDWTDRNTCVLFGDGAGAVVLREVEPGYGLLSSFLAAEGSGIDLIKIPAGGASMPCSEEVLEKRLNCIQMSGNEVFKFAVRAIPQAARKALHLADLKISDVDYFIPHQANGRIIEAAAKRLHVHTSKVVYNISRYGNTSTASIPLAIDELYQQKRLKKGDVLLLVGFGSGLTWGANVVRWSK